MLSIFFEFNWTKILRHRILPIQLDKNSYSTVDFCAKSTGTKYEPYSALDFFRIQLDPNPTAPYIFEHSN